MVESMLMARRAALPVTGRPRDTGTAEFANNRLEWRRLVAEAGGTFLLVLVAPGADVVNAVSHGQVGRTATVTAPGLMVLALGGVAGEGGGHSRPRCPENGGSQAVTSTRMSITPRGCLRSKPVAMFMMISLYRRGRQECPYPALGGGLGSSASCLDGPLRSAIVRSFIVHDDTHSAALPG